MILPLAGDLPLVRPEGHQIAVVAPGDDSFRGDSFTWPAKKGMRLVVAAEVHPELPDTERDCDADGIAAGRWSAGLSAPDGPATPQVPYIPPAAPSGHTRTVLGVACYETCASTM